MHWQKIFLHEFLVNEHVFLNVRERGLLSGGTVTRVFEFSQVRYWTCRICAGVYNSLRYAFGCTLFSFRTFLQSLQLLHNVVRRKSHARQVRDITEGRVRAKQKYFNTRTIYPLVPVGFLVTGKKITWKKKAMWPCTDSTCNSPR